MAQHTDGSPRRTRTIFFGGGTPSLLTVKQITRLLNTCRETFAVDPDAEITLEANPGTLSAEQLAGLRNAGVNRLNMGAQSFDAELLKTLGRIHSPEEISQALHNARGTAFESPDTSRVSIGTIVTLRESGTKKEETYTILGAWDGDPELEWVFPDEPELQQTAQLLQRGRSPEPPLDPAFRAALRRRLMQEAWERAAPALPWWRQLFAPRAMAWAGATIGVLLIAVVVYTLTFTPTPPSTQVVVSSPLQGAHAVAATRPIELKFSQPMDTSAVEQSIQIQPATTVRTFQWVD